MAGEVRFWKSQILLRDYEDRNEVRHVILEMCEEVGRRARERKKAGRTISLGIGYSERELGGGFHRSRSIDEPTNATMDLYRICLKLFKQFDTGRAVRKISTPLSTIPDANLIQLDLSQPNKHRKKNPASASARPRARYGSAALLRAVSYTTAGTALKRAKLVGGHKA